jgi:hypothetical protein
MAERRRFPPPWSADEATESFCIRDPNGQVLAYVFMKMHPVTARLRLFRS